MCDFWRKYRALCCENWLFWIYLEEMYIVLTLESNKNFKRLCQKLMQT